MPKHSWSRPQSLVLHVRGSSIVTEYEQCVWLECGFGGFLDPCEKNLLSFAKISWNRYFPIGRVFRSFGPWHRSSGNWTDLFFKRKLNSSLQNSCEIFCIPGALGPFLPDLYEAKPKYCVVQDIGRWASPWYEPSIYVGWDMSPESTWVEIWVLVRTKQKKASEIFMAHLP